MLCNGSSFGQVQNEVEMLLPATASEHSLADRAPLQPAEIARQLGENKVGVAVNVAICSIVDQSEQIDVIVDLIYCWLAPDVKQELNEKRETDTDDNVFARVWNPLLRIANAVKPLDTISEKTLCLDKELGLMHKFHQVSGTLVTPVYLTNFPLDRQAFAIRLQTFRHTADVAEIICYPGRENQMLAKFMCEGWLLGPPLALHRERTSTSSSGKEYARSTVYVPVERQATWYIWNVFVPNFVIVFLAVYSCLIDHKDIGSRGELVITLVLTLIGTKFSTSKWIPKKVHSSILDSQHNWGIAVLGIVAVHQCAAKFLDRHGFWSERVHLWFEVCMPIFIFSWWGLWNLRVFLLYCCNSRFDWHEVIERVAVGFRSQPW